MNHHQFVTSATQTKPRREKSPSELGEEVIRYVLEDAAEEERKKQAAADRAAQYGGGASTKAAAGNWKTPQYGGAAGQSGEAASYSSPAATKPTVRSQKATPYGSVTAAQYNSPAAVKPMAQKREKTPSELGDEVVARMLVDEGLMDPKELEEYLAEFEAPPAQALANAGLDENAIRGAQWGGSLSDTLQKLDKRADPIRVTPEWQALATAQDLTYAGLDRNAMLGTQLGSSFSNAMQKLNEMAAPIRTTPEWQALENVQNLNYAGLDENALMGLGYGDSLFQLDQKADAIRATPEWQVQATAQNLAYAGLDENALKGLEYGDGLFQLNQKADAIRATPKWQVQATAQNLAYAGLDGNAQWGFEKGKPMGEGISQFIKETHLAPGTSFKDYAVDRFKSGLWNGAEGAWNSTVDFARAITNADLEQQIQQVQQYAWLGEPYQQSADLVEDSVRTVREAVPEAAENLRSHQASEYARQIDELYDAGGLYRLGGDVAASIGQIAPSIAMKILTGEVGSMAYLYASVSGNAAAEARAGGADEETAQLYGILSGGIEVLTEQLGDYITGNDKGVLNTWLMGMAESNTGREALNHLVSTLGKGAQKFISEIAEAYLAKMWNGDEKGFGQTIGEMLPDAFFQGLISTLTESIASLPSDISKVEAPIS